MSSILGLVGLGGRPPYTATKGGLVLLTKTQGIEFAPHGVTVNGPINLPSEVPHHASQMYARNVSAFLQNLVRDREIHLNTEDQIIQDTLLTHDKEVVNPRVRELLGLPASSPSTP